MTDAEANVVMYTQPRCSSCDAAKAWLAERGLNVEVIDIRSDYQHLYDFLDTGSRTTPTLMIGETMLEGFDPDAWNRALDGIQTATPLN